MKLENQSVITEDSTIQHMMTSPPSMVLPFDTDIVCHAIALIRNDKSQVRNVARRTDGTYIFYNTDAAFLLKASLH